ncbi:MAG: MlaD family protein [Deltaproteobacteria bacterium]|nr:MlaD family protein [Deltaproteobacteria bacterium]
MRDNGGRTSPIAVDAKGSNYLRVGIFVALGLLATAALIFVIGNERNLFQSHVILHTSFTNASGLRAGSPVRLGGIVIGSVTAVSFGREPRDTQMHVDFEITQTSLVRVRRNSVAEIASKGLLGDKALDITMGDPAQPAVPNGGTIEGRSEDALADAMRNAGTILARANTVLDTIIVATRPLTNPQLSADLVALVHDLRLVGDQVATGDGTVGRLLRDPRMAEDIRGTLTAARGAIGSVERTTHQVEALARDARTGRGMIHALVYDERGGQAIGRLGEAAGEVAAITRDVRTGNGGMHNLIYGDDLSAAARDVRQATSSMRDIMRDVQRGRGTIGGLLVDPSIYEDIKSLVGNISRNEVLRSMVRYSIRTSERDGRPTPATRPAQDPTPPAPSATPAP